MSFSTEEPQVYIFELSDAERYCKRDCIQRIRMQEQATRDKEREIQDTEQREILEDLRKLEALISRVNNGTVFVEQQRQQQQD